MSTRYELRTFKNIIDMVLEQAKIQSTDLVSVNRVKRNINSIYLDEVVPYKQWQWLRGQINAQQVAYFNTGTASLTASSVAVTLTESPAVSYQGYKFSVDGDTDVYTIRYHSANTSAVILDVPYGGATNSAVHFKIWKDAVPLPQEADEVLQVTHSYSSNPVMNLGLLEFRRAVATSPKAEGRPSVYTTSDWIDPDPYTVVSGIPSSLGRSASGMVRSLVFSASLGSSEATAKIRPGDRLQISLSGNATYNIEAVCATLTTTTSTNDTITFTSPINLTESYTSDTAFVVKIRSSESYERYRELFIYPSLYNSRTTLHVDYIKSATPMEEDTDEPLMAIKDRIVLAYGALWLTLGRERNPEDADKYFQLFQRRLDKMAGKTEDSPDKPMLAVSKLYLGAKRANRGGPRSSISGSSDTFGGGSSRSVTGTPNQVAVFNSAGDLVSSPTITTTELSNVELLNAGTANRVAVFGSTGVLERNAALTPGSLVEVAGTGLLQDSTLTPVLSVGTIDSGTKSADGASISGTDLILQTADGTYPGVLSPTDWMTFNGKQDAGNYITALTGDVTASGPGSVASTLATVNSNVGSFGSSTAIPSLTVNGKGLITAASTNAVVAPAGTVTGTTLASNVVTSSLTTVGTIGTGVWNGTTIDVAHGGTGQTTLPAHGVLIGNGTSGVAATSAGTSGRPLLSGGASADPSFGALDISTSAVTGVLPNANTTATSANTASAIVARDSSGNFSANNISANSLIEGYTTTATAAGTTTLTVSSAHLQYFTGSTTQTVKLPVVTTLVNGQQYCIVNLSSGVVTVQTSGSNTIQAMAANTQLIVTVVDTTGGTGTASWSSSYAALGTVPVGIGGTGLTSGTSGGILGYTASGTLASSAALTANQLIVGGGAGATPSTLAAGSQYQVLRMGATTPAYGAVNLDQSAAVTGALAIGNGGTGQTTKAAGFDALSPMSASGDIIYGGASGTGTRLAKGTDGQVLKLSSGLPTWGGASASLSIAAKTTTYTATSSDDVITVDGSSAAWTLSLPAAASNTGKVFYIKRIDDTPANAVTIDPNGSETIDGATTYALYTKWEDLTITSDGTNWVVLNHKATTPWASYTPTFSAGFGTVTNASGNWRRVGDSVQVRCSCTTGTVAVSLATITLPASAAIDSNKLPISNTSGNAGPVVGRYSQNTSGDSNGEVLTATGTSTSLVYIGSDNTAITNGLVPQNGSAVLANSKIIAFEFTVPVSGWKE